MMASKDFTDPVRGFLDVYGRKAGDLLDADVLSAPGVFEGERQFIQFADHDYDVDRHWAFRIKREQCALIVVDLQEDFVNPKNPMCVPEAYRQIPRVKRTIEACRSLGVPVIYSAHNIASDCCADFSERSEPLAAGAIQEGTARARSYQEIYPRPPGPAIRVQRAAASL